jgi:D-lactate dehydrogenase (cytochrome)
VALELNEQGFELLVQPGYRLSDLRRDLAIRRPALAGSQPGPADLASFRTDEYFWPPDPGETSATMGGLAATRAAGPNRMSFGTAGDHITALSAILSDGQEHVIRRGIYTFGPEGLKLPTGGRLEVDPTLLGLAKGADLVDLLIGGQGMYGFISGLWLRLTKAPANVWALVFFPENEEGAAALIEKTLGDTPEALVSLDFLDLASLSMVADLRRSADKLAEIPEPPDSAGAAVLIELMADDENLIEEASEAILNNCQDVGCDPDLSWAMVGPETAKMHLLRHAVPEAIGGQLDVIRGNGFPAVKMATDMTRPDLPFGRCLSEYRRDIRETGLSAVIFGHAKDNHLHVNLLPSSQGEAQRAAELFVNWLKSSVKAGGELFLEHGVGKLKKDLLLACERPERIAALQAAKKALDPKRLFNPHNLFD